ncbi:hypothetical protein WKW77_12435 [Variovorax ureilyticus]|uniref:DUF4394 domain-containing protein n=1 Tax=Variovorax ureilyticus TaxID=1836198 RepID=A0ABU8VG21_9BURK
MRLRYCAGAAMLAVVAACGGGGGGGGGAVLPAVQTSAPTPALSLTVKVNGNEAQASNGRYAVKPGDSIAVSSNQAVNWTPTPTPAETATPRTPSVAGTSWTARVANLSAAAAVLTVGASTDASHARDVVFDIAPGDARNGSYKVFATNGSRLTLTLDFDNMAYAMTDENDVTVADAIAVDPTDSTAYIFASTRVSAVAANSRFRMTADTVVGAFPFHAPKVLTSYAVQPFVASRALVTTQAALDGAYTRLGINLQTSTRDSNIRQSRISGGGTVLQLCNDVAITSIAACTLLVDYTVSPGPTPGLWKVANVADPVNDWGYFAMARVAGKNVYLSAGTSPGAPNDSVFRIGLEESAAWPNLNAIGGDTSGSWGTMVYTATTYDTMMVRTDATGYGFAGLSLGVPSFTISNLKSFSAGGAYYFTAQDGTLAAVVGARSGPAAGQIQIGLAR